MTHPWVGEVSAERAVLLTLSLEPQDCVAISRRTDLSVADVTVALEQLTEANLVIREGDDYELTGPLCWFGTFTGALSHFARKRLLVTVASEPMSHLYLCDVRVKGGRKVGDPLTETRSVLACGRTVTGATRAPAEADSGPTCPDCASAVAANA